MRPARRNRGTVPNIKQSSPISTEGGPVALEGKLPSTARTRGKRGAKRRGTSFFAGPLPVMITALFIGLWAGARLGRE